MRRKHFEAIAAALKHAGPWMPPGTFEKHHRDDHHSWTAYKQWEADVEAIALALATTNPHFDKARFLLASGVE